MENMKENVCLFGRIWGRGVKNFFFWPHSTARNSEIFIYYDFSCKNVSSYYAWIINVGQSFSVSPLRLSMLLFGLYTLAMAWKGVYFRHTWFKSTSFLVHFGDNFSFFFRKSSLRAYGERSEKKSCFRLPSIKKLKRIEILVGKRFNFIAFLS
jgi:hypothetical protein